MRELKLTGRYYRTIPIDDTGYETEELVLDADRTALVAMHCWDIGCEGGQPLDPRFCVGMGYPETFAEAERIMREVIRPAADAARAAGVLVCHVESATITPNFEQAKEEAEEFIGGGGASQPPVVPGWREKIVARSHGENYAGNPPYAGMSRAQIIAPEPGEPMAYQTGQFDRQMRKRGIENLIYTGFATDMCVLRAPGGIEPMAPYGYRTFLMRDATVGVEIPITFEERIATRWGIGYFETHLGDSVLSDEFIRACESLA